MTNFFEIGYNMIKSAQPRGDNFHMPEWASWSLKEASEKTGYHREYIRWLLAEGRIEGEKLGNMWLVKVDSLREYLTQGEDTGDARFGPHKK